MFPGVRWYADSENCFRPEINRSSQPNRLAQGREWEGEVFKVAFDSDKNPAAQYVIFQRAMRIAAGLGNQVASERIVEELNARFAIDTIAVRTENLQRMLEASISVTKKRHLLRSCIELIDAATDEEQFEVALEMAGGLLTFGIIT